jgi:uncharacterized membrane protein YvbJ
MSSLISCPHCAHQIHESAPSCPQCGAARTTSVGRAPSAYTSYDQVLWYRKLWFAIASVVLFMPLFLVIAFTGDIYFVKKGQLQTLPPKNKFIVLGIFVVLVLIRLQG